MGDLKTPRSAAAFKERMRSEVLREIVETESAYVEDLAILTEVFMAPMRTRGILTVQELQQVFSSVLAQIQAVNVQLQKDLAEQIRLPVLRQTLGDVFLKLADYFRIYMQYCANQDAATQAVDQLRRTNAQFASFLETAESNPRCRSLDLGAYLIKPVQRLCKYPLLLSELLKYQPAGHRDTETLQRAIEKVREVVQQVNEHNRKQASVMKLITVQNSVVEFDGSNALKLVSPSRRYVTEGPFSDLSKLGDGRYFLLSDMLILTVTKKVGAIKKANLRKYTVLLASVRSVTPYRGNQVDLVFSDAGDGASAAPSSPRSVELRLTFQSPQEASTMMTAVADVISAVESSTWQKVSQFHQAVVHDAAVSMTLREKTEIERLRKVVRDFKAEEMLVESQFLELMMKANGLSMRRAAHRRLLFELETQLAYHLEQEVSLKDEDERFSIQRRIAASRSMSLASCFKAMYDGTVEDGDANADDGRGAALARAPQMCPEALETARAVRAACNAPRLGREAAELRAGVAARAVRLASGTVVPRLLLVRGSATAGAANAVVDGLLGLPLFGAVQMDSGLERVHVLVCVRYDASAAKPVLELFVGERSVASCGDAASVVESLNRELQRARKPLTLLLRSSAVFDLDIVRARPTTTLDAIHEARQQAASTVLATTDENSPAGELSAWFADLMALRAPDGVPRAAGAAAHPVCLALEQADPLFRRSHMYCLWACEEFRRVYGAGADAAAVLTDFHVTLRLLPQLAALRAPERLQMDFSAWGVPVIAVGGAGSAPAAADLSERMDALDVSDTPRALLLNVRVGHARLLQYVSDVSARLLSDGQVRLLARTREEDERDAANAARCAVAAAGPGASALAAAAPYAEAVVSAFTERLGVPVSAVLPPAGVTSAELTIPTGVPWAVVDGLSGCHGLSLQNGLEVATAYLQLCAEAADVHELPRGVVVDAALESAEDVARRLLVASVGPLLDGLGRRVQHLVDAVAERTAAALVSRRGGGAAEVAACARFRATSARMMAAATAAATRRASDSFRGPHMDFGVAAVPTGATPLEGAQALVRAALGAATRTCGALLYEHLLAPWFESTNELLAALATDDEWNQ